VQAPRSEKTPSSSGYRGVAIVLAIGLAFMSGVTATLMFSQNAGATGRTPRTAVITGATLRTPERDVKTEPSASTTAEPTAKPAAPMTAPPKPRPPETPVDLSGRDLFGEALKN
jgi:hypothetical protein